MNKVPRKRLTENCKRMWMPRSEPFVLNACVKSFIAELDARDAQIVMPHRLGNDTKPMFRSDVVR